ncbi:MAG TPA: type II toxin-antitoxin system death-on-curing family toxin [Polyangiales bacterium]
MLAFDDVVFLEVEDVDAAHDAALALGGGSAAVLTRGLIESATMAPRAGYYTSLAELAAVYAHGLAKNHGYQDGNKRTATLVMLKFLAANGYDVTLSAEWVEIMVAVADGSMTRGALVEHIARAMGGDPVALG